MPDTTDKSLIVTGAGGFVGQRLIQRLAGANYRRITCISRRISPDLNAIASEHPNVAVIGADLFDVERYRPALANIDFAIHLAAATGKAPPDTYDRVNTEGTAVFAEECRRAGVRGLVHFSSIAVNFSDISYYPYAQSKQRAERIVANAGVPYVILRPTIIFGPQSPIWHNFLTMARAPVPFVFGNGRTRIQPIDVEDLIDVVMHLIAKDGFDNAVYELGGADIVTIDALVRIMRQHCSGRTARRVLHIPTAPLVFALKRLEPFILDALPFTAGQLTSFIYDGVAAPAAPSDAIPADHAPLNEIVDRLVRRHATDAQRAGLTAEGQKLGVKMTGKPPSQLAIQKYIQAHEQGLIEADAPVDWFDKLLCRAAAIAPLFYLIDAYAAVFLPTGLLRKKMILLAAILECLPEAQNDFREPESGNPLGFALGLLPKILTTGLALAVAVPVLLPLQLLSRISQRQPVKSA